MAATKYTYSIQNDFPNHEVSLDRLTEEIRSSDIVTALDYISTSGDACDIWFKDALSTGDQTILGTIVANHSGEPLPETAPPVHLVNGDGTSLEVDAEKKLVAAPGARLGDEVFLVTPNFCDKCTWHDDSAEVLEEVLTDSGDGLTFHSLHTYWIDLRHGRLYQEDEISEAGIPPVILVDGVQKQERFPFSDTGGDFEIDYESGDVTFFASQTGKTVKATYRYAQGSVMIIAPVAGKVLRIEEAHCQFTQDVIMNDTICHQVWMTNPEDPEGPKIPVSDVVKYKTVRDIIDDAHGAYPSIPAIGGTARGTQSPTLEFPFVYRTVRDLLYSYGLEMRIWLEDHKVYDGSFVTVTFYGTSFDEPSEPTE